MHLSIGPKNVWSEEVGWMSTIFEEVSDAVHICMFAYILSICVESHRHINLCVMFVFGPSSFYLIFTFYGFPFRKN